MTAEIVVGIRTALLAFYDANARPLPWRATRDAYAIWISEVMTQQTRVDTAIPYYDRWLRTFPNVDALAAAADDDVLKAWEGLGYYSRARNLRAAAQVIRERHGGALPADYDALRALPGVGEYTAGAVASIAFGDRRAAVDGNVRRVLARLFDIPDPAPGVLREIALALVPGDRPGDFNQALMELGATTCTPRNPDCERCPLAALCIARAAGTVTDRPRRPARKTIPTIDVATAVLRDPNGHLLLTRRPSRGLLAGMWCFPGVEVGSSRHVRSAVRRIALEHASSTRPPMLIGSIEHAFSHRRERYHCMLVDVTGTPPRECTDAVWSLPTDRSLALPRAQQRIRELAVAAV